MNYIIKIMLKRGLIEIYNEENLLKEWVNEVPDALGYETLQEMTLPNDRMLFESFTNCHDAAAIQAEGST